MKERYKKLRNGLIIGAVLSFIIILAMKSGLFDVWENGALDRMFLLRGTIPEKRIAIAKYDDHSYDILTKKLGEKQEYEYLSDYRNAVNEYGAGYAKRLFFTAMISNLADADSKIVGMDFLFEGPSLEEYDNKLAKAMKRHNGVVLAGKFSYENAVEQLNEYLENPYDKFGDVCAAVGYINQLEDPVDGICRQTMILRKVEDTYYPAFALQCALQYMGISFDSLKYNAENSCLEFDKGLSIPVNVIKGSSRKWVLKKELKKIGNQEKVMDIGSYEDVPVEMFIMNINVFGPPLRGGRNSADYPFQSYSLVEMLDEIEFDRRSHYDLQARYTAEVTIMKTAEFGGCFLDMNGFCALFPDEAAKIDIEKYDATGCIKQGSMVKKGDALLIGLKPLKPIQSQDDLIAENFEIFRAIFEPTAEEQNKTGEYTVNNVYLDESAMTGYFYLLKETLITASQDEFKKHFPESGLTESDFERLDERGFIKEGLTVKEGDVIAAFIDAINNKPVIERLKIEKEFQDYGFTDMVVEQVVQPGTGEMIQIDLRANKLKNTIVLGATTQVADQDFYPTPFDGTRSTPGVELHASAIATIINKRFYTRLDETNRIFIIAAICILLSMTFAVAKPLIGAIIMIGGAFLYQDIVFKQFKFHSLWIDYAAPLIGIFVVFTANIITNFVIEQKEKMKIKGAFSNYVNASVVNELLKDPTKLKLGGEKKVLTVQFSDLAGFTSISEALTPEELVMLLNEYLGAMTDIILASDGLLDKYIGDAVMAAWGAPIDMPNHAEKACQSVIDQLKKLRELRVDWSARGLPYVDARFGLNTGPMVVGNMGSQQRMNYTLMGDSVNLGSRLEGINKQYGTNICISEFTKEHIGDKFLTRVMDVVRVKGKLKPVGILELIDRPSEVTQEKHDVIGLFEEGFTLYQKQKWDDAVAKFEKALKIDPEDGPSKLYIGRCGEFKKAPPEEDWDGVWTMKTK